MKKIKPFRLRVLRRNFEASAIEVPGLGGLAVKISLTALNTERPPFQVVDRDLALLQKEEVRLCRRYIAR